MTTSVRRGERAGLKSCISTRQLLIALQHPRDRIGIRQLRILVHQLPSLLVCEGRWVATVLSKVFAFLPAVIVDLGELTEELGSIALQVSHEGVQDCLHAGVL